MATMSETSFNGLPAYGSLIDAFAVCFQRWANPKNRYRYASILTSAERDRFYVVFGHHPLTSYPRVLLERLQPGLVGPGLIFGTMRWTKSTWSRAEYSAYFQVDAAASPPHLYGVQRGHAYSPEGFCLANQLAVPYEQPE